jgi:hypothetical protein
MIGYSLLDIGYCLGSEGEESPISNKELPISKAGVASAALLSFMIGYSLLDIGYCPPLLDIEILPRASAATNPRERAAILWFAP